MYSDDRYVHPTPQEVDALIKMTGWKQVQVALLTGVNYTVEKGSPTLRRWKVATRETSTIPYSSWRLMLLAAGVVSIDDDIDSME